MADAARLEGFIATRDRYTKASARRRLLAVLPMSPEFADLLGMAGQTEAPRHVFIERLVDLGTRIVAHSERVMRGSTLHVTIGRALTIPNRAGPHRLVWAMDESGEYGEAYAKHLGAPSDPEGA